MQIIVTGNHIDVTDSLREYVSSKLEKLERHFEQVSNIHVVLSVEKLRQKVEANLHLPNNDIHAEAEHDDMYAAIDALIDKLDRQVKKHKEKKAHHKNGESLKNQAVE
jgi:putative sigma-54 modulation protein